MNASEIETLLRQTFSDYRVSRSEKKAIKSHLEQWKRDDQTALVRSLVFKIAQDELLGTESKEILSWVEDVVKMLDGSAKTTQAHESVVLFSPDDDCSSRIRSLIMMARQQIDICVFTITDNLISGEIVAAHRRGVQLRIITDNEKTEDRGSDIDDLAAAGIPVCMDQSPYHMHHKFAIFDRCKLLSGSYNWTVGAAKNNQENLVITDESKLVQRFVKEFERLWQKLL